MRFLPLPFILLSVSVAKADNAKLDAWLQRQATIRSLEVDFTQERKLPALKNPVITPGKLSFTMPDKVRWQLGEPAETLAMSDGSNFFLIEVAKKRARKTSVDSPEAARFSLLSGKAFQSSENFHAAFDVIAHQIDSGIHQYTIQAKDRRMRSQVPWIFLNIDPAKNELRAMEIELQDKSRVRTIFRNPKFNSEIPDSRYTPDLAGYSVK